MKDKLKDPDTIEKVEVDSKYFEKLLEGTMSKSKTNQALGGINKKNRNFVSSVEMIKKGKKIKGSKLNETFAEYESN